MQQFEEVWRQGDKKSSTKEGFDLGDKNEKKKFDVKAELEPLTILIILMKVELGYKVDEVVVY